MRLICFTASIALGMTNKVQMRRLGRVFLHTGAAFATAWGLIVRMTSATSGARHAGTDLSIDIMCRAARIVIIICVSIGRVRTLLHLTFCTLAIGSAELTTILVARTLLRLVIAHANTIERSLLMGYDLTD